MNPQTKPDYIALAMVIIFLLIVAVMVIRKFLSDRATAKAPKVVVAENSAPIVRHASGTAGKLDLNGVEPRIAAMLMAVVAEKTGKALNELRFISIKEDEK